MRLTSRRVIGPFAAAALVAAPVLSDELILVGGGRVSGRIVEKTATRIAIETGPGRVTLPLSRVERIVEGRSALQVFAERAADLDRGDVAGWAELARWAEERELLTQAQLAWQRVLAADPRNSEANAGIGRVAVGGVWMSRDDAYRARGYVSYEGRWLTPAEHEAAVRERQAEEASVRIAREADLRVREAEARAREAEARADEAEAGTEASGGIPLGYFGYGSGYGYGYGYGAITLRPPRRDAGRHHGAAEERPHAHPASTGRPQPPPAAARPASQPAPRPRRSQAAILPPQASSAPKR
jgi:hypothetical protein